MQQPGVHVVLCTAEVMRAAIDPSVLAMSSRTFYGLFLCAGVELESLCVLVRLGFCFQSAFDAVNFIRANAVNLFATWGGYDKGHLEYNGKYEL